MKYQFKFIEMIPRCYEMNMYGKKWDFFFVDETRTVHKLCFTLTF